MAESELSAVFGTELDGEEEAATTDYGEEEAEFRMAAQEAFPELDDAGVDALKRAIEACLASKGLV